MKGELHWPKSTHLLTYLRSVRNSFSTSRNANMIGVASSLEPTYLQSTPLQSLIKHLLNDTESYDYLDCISPHRNSLFVPRNDDPFSLARTIYNSLYNPYSVLYKLHQ